MIVNKPKKNKENSRYSVLYIIMFIMMGTIVAKLLYLQVYKYDDYKEKADVSSTKFISEEAPRGNIYDSEGNVIATNKQTYTLTYMETVDSTKAFYTTMDKVFKILEDNGESFQDDLALKVDDSGNIITESAIECTSKPVRINSLSFSIIPVSFANIAKGEYTIIFGKDEAPNIYGRLNFSL